MRSQALVRLIVFILLMAAVWYFVSDRPELVMPWVFIAAWGVVGAFIPVLVVPFDPEMLRERTQMKPDVKRWDVPIVKFGSVYLPLGMIVVAGLDVRFGWWPSIPLPVQVVGVIAAVLGYLFSVWASATNRFYSRFMRIQSDRGHVVESGGPYRYVRHPGYAGIIVFLLGSALALGSLVTLAANGLMVVVTIVRTVLEDRVLHEELAGYREYADRVRYRLLPGIW